MIEQIIERTGYTHDYILWSRPWISFLIETADAPRYIRGERPEPEIETTDELTQSLAGDGVIVV